MKKLAKFSKILQELSNLTISYHDIWSPKTYTVLTKYKESSKKLYKFESILFLHTNFVQFCYWMLPKMSLRLVADDVIEKCYFWFR